MLALIGQSAIEALDELIAVFDQAISARESHAKVKTDKQLSERARKGEDRQLLLDVILPVLADPSVPDEQVGGILRDTIGMQLLRKTQASRWTPLPADHGQLSRWTPPMPTCASSPRRYAAVGFQGGPGTAELMQALTILKQLNASGGEGVPMMRRRFRAAPVRGLPDPSPALRRRDGLPALLGAVRAACGPRWAAQLRRLRARVAPLR